MPYIKIKSSFCLRRNYDVVAGEVIEATEREAREAVRLKRAVIVDAPAESDTPAPDQKRGRR